MMQPAILRLIAKVAFHSLLHLIFACVFFASSGYAQRPFHYPHPGQNYTPPQQYAQQQYSPQQQTLPQQYLAQQQPLAPPVIDQHTSTARAQAVQSSNVQMIQHVTASPSPPPQNPTLETSAIGSDQCNYSSCNPPAQPQVAAGRCQPCAVAVDCADNCGVSQSWKHLHRYNFQPLAHGEYLGPTRLPSTKDYRVRVGDRIRFIYVLNMDNASSGYRLQAGDTVQITSVSDDTIKQGDLELGRGVAILDDGMLYLEMIGGVRAAGLTIPQLERVLEEAYTKDLLNPAISVVPVKTNTRLENIRDAVDGRAGAGGQNFADTVHPDGTIRLPKIGSICVQGMTLGELKREVNLRYRQRVSGLEIEPVLDVEAPHFVYVYGEVGNPNRFELLGPTSVSQALAMAGGVSLRGNNREIVIFRRAEDWRLVATRIDIRGAHLGKVPLPTDEIWLRDNDLIIVPPKPIARFDDFVEQVFVRGIYGIFPFAQVGEGFNANGFVQ